jgi:predicted amidohydrolase
MRICCCQFDILWEDKTANYDIVRRLLHSDKPEADSLVLLPEMFATGFSMNVAGIAEDRMDGPTPRFLSDCAKEFSVFMTGGFVTCGPDGKGRNELAVFSPDGSRICDYSKIHPFSYGRESRHYSGGSQIRSFAWAGAKVSPFICYDLRFPEIFRIAVCGGTEILIVIANWPQAREMHWLALLRARAVENQCYVAGVNRIGGDPNVAYSGRSVIIEPRGEIVADAGNSQCMISAEVDLSALHDYRREFPALMDIHPEFLGPSKGGA